MKETTFYETPLFEVIEVSVEQGFAMSPGSGFDTELDPWEDGGTTEGEI